MSGFAAWDAGWRCRWGHVVKRTEKTISVREWNEWDGGHFGERVWRKDAAPCVFFETEREVRKFAAAVNDLFDREEDTRLQYAAKRKALFAVARELKGE